MYLNKYDDLIIYENFLTYAEEENVINKLKKSETPENNNGERSSIQRFGRYRPSMRNLETTIPNYLSELSQKLYDQGIVAKLPDAISVNEYFPGQGIEPHIDHPDNGDVVTILGLGSYTLLNFSNRKKHDSFQVYFSERAVIQMRNEIRNEWEHWIEATSCDLVGGHRMERGKRYSIVFRHSTWTKK